MAPNGRGKKFSKEEYCAVATLLLKHLREMGFYDENTITFTEREKKYKDYYNTVYEEFNTVENNPDGRKYNSFRTLLSNLVKELSKMKKPDFGESKKSLDQCVYVILQEILDQNPIIPMITPKLVHNTNKATDVQEKALPAIENEFNSSSLLLGKRPSKRAHVEITGKTIRKPHSNRRKKNVGMQLGQDGISDLERIFRDNPIGREDGFTNEYMSHRPNSQLQAPPIASMPPLEKKSLEKKSLEKKKQASEDNAIKETPTERATARSVMSIETTNTEMNMENEEEREKEMDGYGITMNHCKVHIGSINNYGHVSPKKAVLRQRIQTIRDQVEMELQQQTDDSHQDPSRIRIYSVLQSLQDQLSRLNRDISGCE